MQTLRIEALRKTYGEKTLFEDVNLQINERDRIGLIGTNGTGKTTLLNVLSGQDSADSGAIITPNNYKISYLRQNPQLPQGKTALEAVFDNAGAIFQVIKRYEQALNQLSKNPDDKKAQQAYDKAENAMNQENAWAAESEVKTILTQLHLDDAAMHQPLKTLSGGQQRRVALAAVLIDAADLLILDEPTNHLDFDSVAWLEEYLKNYSGALLVVTHDRYFLDRIATQIIELSFGKMLNFPGNYQAFVAQKAHFEEVKAKHDHKVKQLYHQELAWMKHGAKARSTKQQARINRFNDLQAAVSAPKNDAQDVTINLGQQRLGKQVFELKHANLKRGSHQVLADFSWLVQAGQKIGISGINGAGKSSLLNVLAQKIKLDSGELLTGQTVKIAYYEQQPVELDENMRLINYLNQVGQSVTTKDGQKISTTQLLEQFLFPRFMHGTLINKLSGGEKKRVYLLKLLMSAPNVLLLDEPTNDLDIATLTVLEDYLANFAGTVIVVSHDRYFLDKVADSLLIFHGDGDIEPTSQQFSDYLKQHGDNLGKQPQPVVKKASPTGKPKTKQKKLTYAQKLAFEQLEKEIEQYDEKIDEIKTEMNELDTSQYNRLIELQQQLDQLVASQDEKMHRWEELGALAED